MTHQRDGNTVVISLTPEERELLYTAHSLTARLDDAIEPEGEAASEVWLECALHGLWDLIERTDKDGVLRVPLAEAPQPD